MDKQPLYESGTFAILPHSEYLRKLEGINPGALAVYAIIYHHEK